MSTPKPFTLRVSDDDMGICVRTSAARILLGRSFCHRVVVIRLSAGEGPCSARRAVSGFWRRARDRTSDSSRRDLIRLKSPR